MFAFSISPDLSLSFCFRKHCFQSGCILSLQCLRGAVEVLEKTIPGGWQGSAACSATGLEADPKGSLHSSASYPASYVVCTFLLPLRGLCFLRHTQGLCCAILRHSSAFYLRAECKGKCLTHEEIMLAPRCCWKRQAVTVLFWGCSGFLGLLRNLLSNLMTGNLTARVRAHR